MYSYSLRPSSMAQSMWDQMSGKASGFAPWKADMHYCFMLSWTYFTSSLSEAKGTHSRREKVLIHFAGSGPLCGYVTALLTTSCQSCRCAFAKRQRILPAPVYTAFFRVTSTAEMHEEEKFIVPKHWSVLAGFKGRLQVSIYSLSTEGDIHFIFLVHHHL